MVNKQLIVFFLLTTLFISCNNREEKSNSKTEDHVTSDAILSIQDVTDLIQEGYVSFYRAWNKLDWELINSRAEEEKPGIITNYLKYKKHLCYVYLSTNFLILAENKQTKLFANEISLIEYRHEILYFVKKDGKSIQIKLEHINQKTMFLTKIYDWVLKNNISVGKESNEKMINEVNLK